MEGQFVISFVFCCFLVVCCVNGCEDKNESCPGWAARGECERNPDYMLANCQISCHQCSGSTGGSSGGCVDKSGSCAGWASAGECLNNPAFMFDHCAKSCDSCGISIVG